MKVKIEYVKNLYPIFTKPKRFKVIVGGRGSTKSTGVADYVAAKMANGELWCCARENQNSIEESVHRTILDEIDRLGIEGFDDNKTSITHLPSGGRAFYRGLSRNVRSLKSTLSGIDGLWIEEGEDISENTLDVLTASVRLNAKDSERLLSGEVVKMPEIIVTMNRGSRMGAIAKRWLERAEKELTACGYYEDDVLMVVEMNYTDMPKEWFEASGLEKERLDDLERYSTAKYDHKWNGHYLDEVDGSIIKPEWFDASIDAHKLERLKKIFTPHGARISAHDPFDDGADAGGWAIRHGSIIEQVRKKDRGEIDEVCDWAVALSKTSQADWFVWDGDGMGAGLKRQVSLAFDNTRTDYFMFKGSLSGSAQDNADKIYQSQYGDKSNAKTYADTFKNNRAQYYIKLSDRFYNTYRCVVKGEYIDPDEMISIDSLGVDDMRTLRSELCRIPRKPYNDNGLEQLMSKKEMKAARIESPNLADTVMMCLYGPKPKKARGALNYQRSGIV
ncbi:MAG: phage terminase large subunit [Syntrophobacteria bacterium]